MTKFAAILALLVGFSQVAKAQTPQRLPPDTRSPNATESARIDAALGIAQSIVNKLNEPAAPGETGDGKVAKRNLDAFKRARRDGRVVTLVQPPESEGRQFRGATWPDLPTDPSQDPLGMTAGGVEGNGKYREGQTAIQYCGLNATLAYQLCDCALAIVILHEGHRLEQEISPPGQLGISDGQSFARTAQGIRNERNLAY